MKQTALSRRAFLLGLGAVSSAALLSACSTNAPCQLRAHSLSAREGTRCQPGCFQ